MSRFTIFLSAAVLLVLPAVARAQEHGRVFRLGAGDTLGESVFAHYTVLVETGQVAPVRLAGDGPVAPAPAVVNTPVTVEAGAMASAVAPYSNEEHTVLFKAWRSVARSLWRLPRALTGHTVG